MSYVLEIDEAVLAIDLAVVKRYIAALEPLKRTHRAYACEMWREITHPGVSTASVIYPIVTLPLSRLTPEERAWRALAASCQA